MHRKKGEGVGGRSEHWIPDRASDAQRLNVGLMALGSAEPKAELPGLQLASPRTEAPPPQRPRSRSKNPNAATTPRSCGPSPPRAGPRNRLRVTSPPPSPSTAAPALRCRPPRAPCPTAASSAGTPTHGPRSFSRGGWRRDPPSEHTDQQYPGPPATRRMCVTPLPRDFRGTHWPRPLSRHGVRPVGTALPATQAAEGRAQEVTYAPAVATPSP